MLTAVGALRRRWDLRSYLRYLSPHAIGYTPGPHQVLLPFCFPDDSGLLPNYRGSACIPALRGLSLNQTLPAISVRSSIYEAAPFALCYGLRFRPAPLTGYDPLCCEPSRYRVGASSTRVSPPKSAPSLHIRKEQLI